jgi:hypothetical protein
LSGDTKIRGLSPQEQAACLVAERVLGATAEPWDTDGRQAAVDAMLVLSHGRRAAFEITAVDAPSAIHLDALLAEDDFQWPAPGRWHWSVQVGSRADVPRLRQSYARLGLLCEDEAVERPEHLRRLHVRRGDQLDEDLLWLTEESSSTMFVHIGLPAVDGDHDRQTMVVPAGRGGSVDSDLVGLRAAVADMLDSTTMRRHVAKLARAEADERHLFVPIHRSALPYPVADGLWTGSSVPTDAPVLPDGVTHLWLALGLGRRVLLGDAHGWTQHHPYDN